MEEPNGDMNTVEWFDDCSGATEGKWILGLGDNENWIELNLQGEVALPSWWTPAPAYNELLKTP